MKISLLPSPSSGTLVSLASPLPFARRTYRRLSDARRPGSPPLPGSPLQPPRGLSALQAPNRTRHPRQEPEPAHCREQARQHRHRVPLLCDGGPRGRPRLCRHHVRERVHLPLRFFKGLLELAPAGRAHPPRRELPRWQGRCRRRLCGRRAVRRPSGQGGVPGRVRQRPQSHERGSPAGERADKQGA